jgi:predicted nucleic acid-binding protein
MAERRGRLSPAGVQQAIRLLKELPPAIDEAAPARVFGALLDLMRTHRLTAYDTTYLELAMRSGLALATSDKELRNAATAVGATVLGTAA